jgi:hypothetical protein
MVCPATLMGTLLNILQNHPQRAINVAKQPHNVQVSHTWHCHRHGAAVTAVPCVLATIILLKPEHSPASTDDVTQWLNSRISRSD